MSCKSLRNSKVQFEVGREISEGIQLEASVCFRHLVENLYILRDKIIWKELAENEIQKTEAVKSTCDRNHRPKGESTGGHIVISLYSNLTFQISHP